MEGELIRFSIPNSNSNSFIEGNLVIPDNPIGVVVFAHGSGSSRSSKRNQMISERLNKSRIATLLVDLLSCEEQEFDAQLEKMTFKIPGAVLNKFNILLLTQRLSMVTDWIMNHESLSNLKIGYFASSTGGAAALIASAEKPVKSITIRSGRTDLVDNNPLGQIIYPCLFIVGSKEKSLLDISKQTIKKLRNAKEKELSIIQNASHLLEEEGSMRDVVQVATRWIKGHFS